MARARAGRPYPLGVVRGSSARWRLGGIPACTGCSGQAASVGSGQDGDPRERTDSPAGATAAGPHPCQRARRSGRSVGNGGGAKMLLPLGRDRRAMGRPKRSRFHCHSAARGRFGAQRHALLAGAPWGQCEFERGSDALAHRKHALAHKPARPARSRIAGMGCRTVPGARFTAGSLEPRI